MEKLPNCSRLQEFRWRAAPSPSTVKAWVLRPPMSAAEQVQDNVNTSPKRRRPMRLNVKGHHIEVTPALQSYVEKKMVRIVRHFDQVIDVHCVLTVEKLAQKVEATLHVSGCDIHADASDLNMYAAIDALSDKLDRLVTKHKEKRSDHRAMEGREARL